MMEDHLMRDETDAGERVGEQNKPIDSGKTRRSSPATRLFLVRHGETRLNRERRYLGLRDDALTDRGFMQAQQLADALALFPVAANYSSPLKRAYHTALPIAARHGLEVQVLDSLRE